MSRTKRFPLLALREMSDPQREIAELLIRTRGGIRGPYDALLRSPVLCRVFERTGDYIRFHSSVPTQLNEMTILMTAQRWGAQHAWFAHEKMASQSGLDSRITEAIARGERPRELDRQQALVYDFVRELLTSGTVSDDSFEVMSQTFDEQFVVDLVAAVGFYTWVAFLLNVDNFPLPEGEPMPLGQAD